MLLKLASLSLGRKSQLFIKEENIYKFILRFNCVENIFCRAMRCIRAAYAVMRCLSVCVSVCVSVRVCVTFVNHVKMNKHIFEIFFTVG